MRKAEKILIEMDRLLNLLIDNAEGLLQELTRSQVQENILKQLQKQQDEWLTQYILKNDLWVKYDIHILDDEPFVFLHTQVEQKLDKFQALNAKFIERIKDVIT